MNKKDYTGWKDVFKFSLIQGIKSKTYFVTLLILAGIFVLGIPVIGFLSRNDSEEPVRTQIDTLRICNMTEFDFDCANILPGERYKSIKISIEDATEYESIKEEMKNNPETNDVLVGIDYDPMGLFSLTFVKSLSPGYDTKDYDKMTEDFQKGFEEVKISSIEVTKEQMDIVNAPVSYSVEEIVTDENSNVTIEPIKENEGISLSEYGVMLGGLIFVMMIINLSGGQIANQIVTEKSTRVVEYLMINVKPLALIVGKILSSLVMVLLEFAVMIIAFLLGNRISEALFGTMGVAEDNTMVLFVKSLASISVERLVICIVIVVMGILFYSIIAGLAGASVSKMEELGEGMKMYQSFLMSGYFIGLFVCIMQMTGGVDNSIITALSLVPVSAPFLMPSCLILGKVSITAAIIGIIVLGIITVLLFIFTSRVYEAMIFHNGKVLKMKDIIDIAKARQASSGEAQV